MKRFAHLLRQLRGERAGMTLIETIVSIALLGIVSLVMAQIMLSTLAANRQTQKHTDKSVQVAGGVAADSDTSSTASDGDKTVTSTTGGQQVTIRFGNGDSVTVSGSTVTGTVSTASGGETIYQSFVPDE